MDRAEGRRRRRWGISGLTAVVVHGGLALGCLLGVSAYRERADGRLGMRALAEEVINFDLVLPAEAAPPPEQPAPAPVAAPAAIASRRGRAVRRPRPFPTVPIRMPEAAPVEPPPFEEPYGRDAESLVDSSAATTTALSSAAGFSTSSSSSSSSSAPSSRPESIMIPASEGSYLRIYDTFPSLPRSLWVSGRVYAVVAQVCVSTEGRVSDVTIKRGAAPELDRAVSATLRAWRYRPRLIQGTPRPFCHLMKLEFALRQ